METSISHEIKVGIFAIVGVILFCVSVILLGGDRWFLTRNYHLKVHLPQVQGLGKGSVVTLAGLQIGNVEDVKFVAGSPDVEVVMSVESAVQSRITEGSTVIVKTQGALGDKYIFINPGPATAPPLKDGSVVDVDKTPDFIDMIASKGAQLGELVNVIKELHTLFESINKDGRPAKLMTNLVEGSENFNKAMAEVRETLKTMRTETLVPLSSAVKKIDNGQGTLGALINDPSLYNKISSFMGETPRNKFLKPIIRESIQTNEGHK